LKNHFSAKTEAKQSAKERGDHVEIQPEYAVPNYTITHRGHFDIQVHCICTVP